MKMRWLWLLALVACADTQVTSGVAVKADGRTVIVEGNRALRAMLVELEWDADLEVTAVRAGDDAARLTVFETDFEPGAHRAKVVIADGRGVRLPARGTLVTVDATGSGALRVVRAEGADDGPSAVDIEVRR
jgi:hypothetical protein